MDLAAAANKRRVFRAPLAARLGLLFVVAVFAALTVFMLVLAILVLGGSAFPKSDWRSGLIPLIVAAFLVALLLYVLRDFRAKWGLRVVLDADQVKLDLPSSRMLIRRPPSQHVTLSYADIAAVETRLEAYPTWRMANMQRAYALRRRSGELIFLFEDRALATGFASATFGGIARELATRAGVPLRDLGMAEGRGGILAVWGAHAPDWSAPALPAERQRALWNRAAATGAAAGVAASAPAGSWLGSIGRRRPGSEPPPQ
jgi:hypothetical protein